MGLKLVWTKKEQPGLEAVAEAMKEPMVNVDVAGVVPIMLNINLSAIGQRIVIYKFYCQECKELLNEPMHECVSRSVEAAARKMLGIEKAAPKRFGLDVMNREKTT